MAAADPINMIILGAGKGGAALLELFAQSPLVTVVGVADKNPDAPGLRLAHAMHIPTTQDAAALVERDCADLIVDVTGDPALGALIASTKSPEVELLSGTAARLVWLLVQREQDLRGQLIHAEKLATVGTFSSGIAHDLNNPLQGVLGFAQLILEEQDPASMQSYAREIIDAAHHMATLSKRLTLYARGNTPGDVCDVQVEEVLEKAARMVEYGKNMDDVEVVQVYGPAPSIRIDAGELLQVFINLITNAVQAMQGKGRLTLAIQPESTGILVSISDTGPGIDPNHLERIFTPFFTTKEPGTGTGLGLYIVESIVKKSGGQISVESEPGKGTTFQLRFPAAGRSLEAAGP
jgi:signal transduction histidine kinase